MVCFVAEARVPWQDQRQQTWRRAHASAGRGKQDRVGLMMWMTSREWSSASMVQDLWPDLTATMLRPQGMASCTQCLTAACVTALAGQGMPLLHSK